jgi:hypothetical protein
MVQVIEHAAELAKHQERNALISRRVGEIPWLLAECPNIEQWGPIPRKENHHGA